MISAYVLLFTRTTYNIKKSRETQIFEMGFDGVVLYGILPLKYILCIMVMNLIESLVYLYGNSQKNIQISHLFVHVAWKFFIQRAFILVSTIHY